MVNSLNIDLLIFHIVNNNQKNIFLIGCDSRKDLIFEISVDDYQN